MHLNIQTYNTQQNEHPVLKPTWMNNVYTTQQTGNFGLSSICMYIKKKTTDIH